MLASGLMAQADEYSYLTIGYNQVEKSIVLETIQKITFKDGQMVVTTSNGSETFPQEQLEKMFFSTEATRVQSVPTQPKSEEEPVYDLSGRRVIPMKKGIYILDGRKVIIK